ncbi:MAG: hypothetical protein ACLR1T_18135 [Evtepia gabavorous]
MMDYFAVEGGRPLEGRVFVHGAKNSALPLWRPPCWPMGRACYITARTSPIFPAALGILSGLGCRVRREGPR